MNYPFDLKAIRTKPEAFDAGLVSRGLDPIAQEIIKLDSDRRAFIAQSEQAQADRRTISQQIGDAKRAHDDLLAEELVAKVSKLKETIAFADENLKLAEDLLKEKLFRLPNTPSLDTPIGKTVADNIEIKRVGKTSEVGDPHWSMAWDFGFTDASEISGSRFSALGGAVARLHRALGQFMLDQHILRGFREVIPPLLVRAHALEGTGQLPKFEEDLFHVTVGGDDQNGFYLIPTAEVSLTNLVRDRILLSNDIKRMVALTDCFRAEAGSAGRDTRGLIRQHQFQKVELVSICQPHQSQSEHEYMTQAAENILELLDLPYRRVLLCSGDLGFSAQKTYDLEVWLPGQKEYREISSVSNCGDFQARRMNTRYKVDGETVYAHTLNGSGLAVGRTLMAVLENYQLDDDVAIPSALQPYMNGHTTLVDWEEAFGISRFL